MNEQGLKMLSEALEIERKGKAFYDDAIAKCKNNLGREIFTTLMKDEVVHIDRIRAIYDSLKSSNVWTKKWESFENKHEDVGKLFSDIVKKLGTDIKTDTSDLDALDVGIGFELKTVKFYEQHLPKAVDPVEKKFIEKMVEEEKKHHKVLLDMKFYLSDPVGWFTEQEHHGLDAG